MDECFQQILSAAESDAFYLALFGALAVPDVCAGMEAEDGRATGERYRAWFDTWAAPKYAIGPNGEVSFNGQDAYQFRCSMLHQGTTQHAESRYARVLFVPRGRSSNVFHNNVLNDALNLDIPMFCRDVVDAATAWRATVEQS
jgi:hypothetical protein